MDTLIADRMFRIAKYLDDLNSKNKVKNRKENDQYGYAKVVEIKRGCSIWVHHLINNNLIIDLQISPTAQSKYNGACVSAIRDFDNFFDQTPVESPWFHARKPDEEHTRYLIDITTKNDEEIFNLLNKIKRFYAYPG